jgi:uncharacterized protein YggU (UPF0235/DUF167 family)
MKINVKVITRAHKNVVEKIDNKNYVVRTTSVPTNGRANKVVQKLLAVYFDTAKSNIQITKGSKSKNKIIYII